MPGTILSFPYCVFLLIGEQSGASFRNQSLDAEMQTKSKREYVISELSFASVSKRALTQIFCYENEFDSHEN